MRRKLGLPGEGWEELDEREVVVGVGPRDPRLNLEAGGVDVDAECAERGDESHLGAAEGDKAQISADGEGRIGGDDLVEANAMDVERAERES